MNLTNKISHLKFLEYFTEVAKERGEQVYIVGGYVRDILLEGNKKEIDFVIVGDGSEFAEAIANKMNVKKVNVFKSFGTAHFVYNGFDLEFVGARKESYNKDSRKPVVESATLLEDLSRRDFTINTLAISLNEKDYGEVIDKFDGLTDLQEKVIKTPLNPNETFDDDPLRIMRAFRFAAQLQFDVDQKILDAANRNRDRLKIVSQERLTDEFFKLLSAPKPSIGLKLMFDCGVMDIVFPEISNLSGVEQRKDHHHKEVFLHTCKVLDNISNETENVWLRFAALVHDIAKPQTKAFDEKVGWTFHGHEELGARMMEHIFRRMKLPLNKLPYIQKLIRLHLRPIALVDETVTDSAIRRLIVQTNEDLEDLITLCRADITSKNPKKVSRYLNNYEIVMQKVRDVQEKDKLREFQSQFAAMKL
ncbi:MAG: CCA tRNA nucleotidyltransferase [Melioribacteraceae bacterium]|nr:CCA tRNA nucleotidyltransferase [Melioribacteraceae bacterium]